MGLGKPVSENALPKLAEKEKLTDFGEILAAGNADADNNGDANSDSDDLF